MITRALPPELTAEEWRAIDRDPDDPYRYGWRDVVQEGADGSVTHERIPLTFEDVLHPQEGDYVVQGGEHGDWCVYLYTVFKRLLRHDPLALVFFDMLFLWDVPGLKGHSPDIAVVFGVPAGHRQSFNVAEEGARPALIIEITSPSTARLDHESKLEEYHLVGVPLYIILDRRYRRGQWTLHLLGYRATPLGYEPLVPNERGWLWLEPVGIWLGIADGKPVCYDASGEALSDAEQLADERDEALARAEVADERAEAEAAARQAAEDHAAAEVSARQAAEARVRELEATIRRLQQGE